MNYFLMAYYVCSYSSSKALGLIYGSKGDMSRRVRGQRKARKKN